MVSSFQQRQDELPPAIVGIGNENQRLPEVCRHFEKQSRHLVEQSPPAVAAPQQALVNPRDQRNRNKALRRSRYQQGYCLKGMSHDVLGLGIVLRLLVELLD